MWEVSYEDLVLADDTPPLLEPMVAAFCERLRAGTPFVDEREAVLALSVEAAPVLDALHVAWRAGEYEGAEAMAQAHEALAMMTLLGRRAALSGMTPTAALALAPAMCEGLRVGGVDVPESTQRTLSIVCMEGYAAGREDRSEERLREALSSAQRWVPIAPSVLLCALGGPLDATALGELAERFGRGLLHEEAAACVVDVRGLADCTAEHARQVAAIVGAATTVGAACMLVVDDTFRGPLRECDVEGLGARLFEDSVEATEAALQRAGLSLRRRLWRRRSGG